MTLSISVSALLILDGQNVSSWFVEPEKVIKSLMLIPSEQEMKILYS